MVPQDTGLPRDSHLRLTAWLGKALTVPLRWRDVSSTLCVSDRVGNCRWDSLGLT